MYLGHLFAEIINNRLVAFRIFDLGHCETSLTALFAGQARIKLELGDRRNSGTIDRHMLSHILRFTAPFLWFVEILMDAN